MAISKKSLDTLEPFDFIIFGGTGDLALRKLFPALYHRMIEGQVKEGSRILAFSRSEMTNEAFKKVLRENLQLHVKELYESMLMKMLEIVSYASGDITNPSSCSSLNDWTKQSKNKVKVYYFATASSLFGSICNCLDEYEMITPESRVVLEKPLGHDGASSEEINKEVERYLDERQIYRIDHYLGKETVQNLMVLRFANNLYEQAWNSNNIQDVQITVAESLGVEKRGGYYDKYGALRDMVQNHLLQLLCLIAMEPPTVLDAAEVRKEKLKVMKSLRFYNKKNIKNFTVRGQYGNSPTKNELPSVDSNSKATKTYLEDINMNSSKTETFVALRAYVDNWRWAGVPFYLRTGKRMAEKYSEITINFKNVPHNVFPDKEDIQNNKLIIRLQPEESIELVQMIKVAGPGGYRYKPFALTLDYYASYGGRLPGAYERLLMDVVRGNQTLFMSRDEVRASWDWIETIMDSWDETDQELQFYDKDCKNLGHEVLQEGHSWYNKDWK